MSVLKKSRADKPRPANCGVEQPETNCLQSRISVKSQETLEYKPLAVATPQRLLVEADYASLDNATAA